MPSPKISILIPTYNRKDALLRTLGALSGQSYDMAAAEVLVLDDYSSEDPGPALGGVHAAYQLRYFRGERNVGQGMLRNAGIEAARGEYVFFLGDDTVPEPDFMARHMRLHERRRGIAVLGRVLWAPELRNEFMDFIEPVQFHYQTIKDPDDVRLHFYTSNISLERKWLDGERYSPLFSNYGLEDLEFGYRLEKKGLRVVYAPKAKVYHYHAYTYEQFCARMRNVGRSAVIFSRLHPELRRRYVPPFRGLMRAGARLLSCAAAARLCKKVYWYSSFVRCYLEGVESALASPGPAGAHACRDARSAVL